jgi:hypothetical protein
MDEIRKFEHCVENIPGQFIMGTISADKMVVEIAVLRARIAELAAACTAKDAALKPLAEIPLQSDLPAFRNEIDAGRLRDSVIDGLRLGIGSDSVRAARAALLLTAPANE